MTHDDDDYDGQQRQTLTHANALAASPRPSVVERHLNTRPKQGYTAFLHITYSTETFTYYAVATNQRVYIPLHGGDLYASGKRKTGDDERVTDTFLFQIGFSRENCIGLVDIEWMDEYFFLRFSWTRYLFFFFNILSLYGIR